MYNNRRYDLARYSVNEGATVEIAESFAETMGSVAGVAIPVETRANFSDVMRGNVRGTVSVIFTMSAAEIFRSSARMRANVVVKVAAGEALAAAAAAVKNIPAALTSEDELGKKIWGSKNIPETLEGLEEMGKSATASKDIYFDLVLGDVLSALMEATTQTTERAVMQVTIPPGGELRIDSDHFLAILDGENVLYAQSGDWINISRDLLRISIESATGGTLSGQLIYTERFL